ncbi:unnamed protein product [Pleuronectes platessa]|uniref:Uncharacterized protein n=1 Tax=Pleuronectes platessa TaxID=8262 RepID=A0A9N7VS71_PLEPL|nr:unnamed protein product [Pleuronectes platessa]
MEKENEKVLASGPKGDETAAGENSNYGTELQKGEGRDELEEREEVEKPSPSPFFYSSKQTPPLRVEVIVHVFAFAADRSLGPRQLTSKIPQQLNSPQRTSRLHVSVSLPSAQELTHRG